MSEKPILFSGPMVRAILDGAKTQDRVVLKPQPWQNEAGLWVWPPPGAKVSKRTWRGFCQTAEADLPGWFDGLHKAAEALPYAPGDRLWVRETWCVANRPDEASYRATVIADGWEPEEEAAQPWRPSIHMPRWASRISLLVTAVKVERLQEISEADAQAEGCAHPEGQWAWDVGGSIDHFADVWQGINAKRPGCSWTDNPWVAAISFEVMR